MGGREEKEVENVLSLVTEPALENSLLDIVGVVTLLSTTFGGCGLGILSRLGRVADCSDRPQTLLNLQGFIFTEALGVSDLINRLCRENPDMVSVVLIFSIMM